KNVTGYDLCKLLAGCWGTLAAMTDVTLKTLPRAEAETTVLVFGLDDATACQAMSIVLGSDCDVSAAAHLPAQAGARIAMAAAGGRPITALRLEGVEPSVRHRRRLVNTIFAARSLAALEGPASRA